MCDVNSPYGTSIEGADRLSIAAFAAGLDSVEELFNLIVEIMVLARAINLRALRIASEVNTNCARVTWKYRERLYQLRDKFEPIVARALYHRFIKYPLKFTGRLTTIQKLNDMMVTPCGTYNVVYDRVQHQSEFHTALAGITLWTRRKDRFSILICVDDNIIESVTVFEADFILVKNGNEPLWAVTPRFHLRDNPVLNDASNLGFALLSYGNTGEESIYFSYNLIDRVICNWLCCPIKPDEDVTSKFPQITNSTFALKSAVSAIIKFAGLEPATAFPSSTPYWS